MTGVDLPHVPGFQALTIHTVRSEVGRDMHTWPHAGFQEPLLSRRQNQRSLTAPESRAMQCGPGCGTEVYYIVPTAVDAQPKRMVACAVTNDPGERDWLSPMPLQAKAVPDCGFDVVAAVGYSHGHGVKTWLEAGITPSVPRSIPSANEQRLEEMEQRVRRRPEVMKRRKAWVEHPCGTMKRGWEHGSCLRRGLEKVRTECSLTVWAYNLRRVLNLVEMPRLLAALG